MEENKAKRSDVEIAKDFEQLFDEIPEPETNEEVTAYLIEAGYDPEVLKAQGVEFVANLIANNWRFISSEETEEATAKINEIPLRKHWNRSQLTNAIEKISSALALHGRQPVMAFRNLEELTDADLAIILQELEYKAYISGIDLELG
jgi:hypothetical protein